MHIVTGSPFRTEEVADLLTVDFHVRYLYLVGESGVVVLGEGGEGGREGKGGKGKGEKEMSDDKTLHKRTVNAEQRVGCGVHRCYHS